MKREDDDVLFWHEPPRSWLLRASRFPLLQLMPRAGREVATTGLVLLRLSSYALIWAIPVWAILRVAGLTEIDAHVLSSALGMEIAYTVLAITVLGILWLAVQMFLPPRVVVTREGLILERPRRILHVGDIEKLVLFDDARCNRMLKISAGGREHRVGISGQVDTQRMASILRMKVNQA